jgi:hypothetical protein
MEGDKAISKSRHGSRSLNVIDNADYSASIVDVAISPWSLEHQVPVQFATQIVQLLGVQGDIATSTMEAEYSALSMTMRDLLPLRELLFALSPSITVKGRHPTIFFLKRFS